MSRANAQRRAARRGVLPGFGLTFGITTTYLTLIVLIPIAGLVLRAAGLGPLGVWQVISAPRALAAFRVSFVIAALATLANMPIGLLLAWTMVRYRFPGRRMLDALVDLPLALPTSVAGVALTALYVDDGWLGGPLAALGLKIAFTPLGIWVALLFVGLPYVVRTVQPVLMELDRRTEEAALTLGARPGQVFARVVLPPLLPALLAGAGLAFARAVGEYGSVIFIAGNRPGVSEIVPLLIVGKLEQYDYAAAAALGATMLLAALLILLALSAVQSRAVRLWMRTVAA
ncbi:sulfate ABC transporter permease subunit CysT [Acidisphaera sp. L21]|uniref:sulfate ABC transporter permease subunit CysT n=1 Tax=Acidisphaera sp. L21 TaxID=1641851 RepID=UPI00131B9D59|nr:sulfate ABC transporter permease subunit CysT [Acidisphaera sp. L21]